MSNRNINSITWILTALALVSVIWWLNADPTAGFTMSLPGTDNRGSGEIAQEVEIGAYFESFNDDYLAFNETWPRFRGDDFDNISKSEIKLIDKFNGEGPRILWSKELGEGHSGAAIYEGVVYVLDYDETKRADVRSEEHTSELQSRPHLVC